MTNPVGEEMFYYICVYGIQYDDKPRFVVYMFRFISSRWSTEVTTACPPASHVMLFTLIDVVCHTETMSKKHHSAHLSIHSVPKNAAFAESNSKQKYE